jgi:hypothetical protein
MSRRFPQKRFVDDEVSDIVDEVDSLDADKVD